MGRKAAQWGRWWRHAQYKIKDGIIVPVRGSNFEEYSVWRKYEDGDAPHESVLQLGRDLQNAASDAETVEELVTGWCSKNGLLGIFLSRALSIMLPPVWERSERHPQYALASTQITYLKGSGGWHTLRRQLILPGREHGSPPIAPGETLARRHLENTTYELQEDEQHYSGTCILRGINARPNRVQTEPIEIVQERYFYHAQRRPHFRVPEPLTPLFWRGYGEPLLEFVSVVRHFSTMISDPAKQQNGLDSYLSDTGSVFVGGEEGFNLQTRATSLLGYYAHMIGADLSGGFTTRSCESCGRPFLSNRYQAKYCSNICQMRQQKRNYRKANPDRTTK